MYLVEGDDGWTMIDAGYDYPEGCEAWERGAQTLGLDLRRDVARIIVTQNRAGSQRSRKVRSPT